MAIVVQLVTIVVPLPPMGALILQKMRFLSNIALIFHKGASTSRTQELQEMHAKTQEPWRGGASGLPAQYKKLNEP